MAEGLAVGEMREEDILPMGEFYKDVNVRPWRNTANRTSMAPQGRTSGPGTAKEGKKKLEA